MRKSTVDACQGAENKPFCYCNPVPDVVRYLIQKQKVFNTIQGASGFGTANHEKIRCFLYAFFVFIIAPAAYPPVDDSIYK